MFSHIIDYICCVFRR